MKNLLITLYQNQHDVPDISFDSFPENFLEEVETMSQAKLYGLAGNLVIDFNDGWDSDIFDHHHFFEKYLQEISDDVQAYYNPEEEYQHINTKTPFDDCN